MKLFKFIIKLGILGAAFGILIGYLGAIHPAFDTFAHFRLHVSLGLVLIGFVILFRKWFLLAAIALTVGATGLYSASVGTVFTAQIIEPEPTKPLYSMLHFNLLWVNTQRENVIDKIIQVDAELISLTEVAERWHPFVDRLNQNWPYMIKCSETGSRGGIRFYSKWPFDNTDQYCDAFGSFTKTKVISPEGLEFTSGSVHLRWPWPASGPKQLARILPELRKIKADALFAGDFNATTWSHAVQKFAKASGMKVISGIGSTWMFDKFPLSYTWWAGLPIDNVMHKGRIHILSAKTLNDLGSDHLPVLIQFQIK